MRVANERCRPPGGEPILGSPPVAVPQKFLPRGNGSLFIRSPGMPESTSRSNQCTGEQRPSRWRWLVLGALLAAGLLTRGWELDTPFDHPDEPIATGMTRWLDHSWDTNWKQASLPDPFNADQYNFSGYYVVLHAWSRVARPLAPSAWSADRGGVVLLRSFSVLCGALVVVWAFLVGQRLADRVAGFAGAALVLVNPQLVADGHYARPEAMLAWLTLVVVWLALCEERWDWRWRLGITAFLVGFMIATKVTMGLILVAPAWIAWRACARPLLPGRLALALAAAGVLTLVGFAAGAPGAIIHPDVFLTGVRFLANQYGGFHEPHSEFGGGIVALALGKFYLVTVGIGAVLLALAAAVHWVRRREWRAVWLVAAPVVAYMAYFAGKHVFFERNLSHVLPLGLIAAGAGVGWLAAAIGRGERWPGRLVATLALGLAAAPGVAVTAPLLTRALSGADARDFTTYATGLRARYAAIEWRPISLIFPDNLATLRKDFILSHPPILVQYQDFNDSYSRHYGEELEKDFVTFDAGFCSGALANVPCSALNVYHGHRTVFKIITGRRWPAPTTR